MKIIKNIMLFLGIVSCAMSLKAQDRNTVWVHGLGEPSDIWQAYDDMFRLEREMNNTRPNGTNINHGGIAGVNARASSANDVSGTNNNTIKDAFNTNPISGANPSRNLGIGHSLGGIVLREVDRDETNSIPTDGHRSVNGIITVGSPNYGAGMLNSLENGNANLVIQDGCQRLAAGPVSSLLPLPLQINGIATNQLCDFFYDEVIINNIGQLNGLSATEDDLKLNSNYFNHVPANGEIGLSLFNSSLPRISVWGNENSPTHWRLASSFLTMDAGFNGGVHSDDFLVHRVNQAMGFYSFMNQFHTTMGIFTVGMGFFNPVAWIYAPIHFYKAQQWNKGYSWLLHSEMLWNALTVCQGTYTLTYTIANNPVHNYCNGYMFGTQQWWNCVSHQCGYVPYDYTCLTNCTSGTTTYTETVIVNHPSDGLVCSYSQVLNDIDQNNNVYEAVGVNHRDETDTRDGQNPSGTDVMRGILNDIWDRDPSDFFYTPE